MDTPIKKSLPKKRLLWFTFGVLLFIYIGYYQFLYHSKRIDSNIYTLNRILDSHLSEIWAVKFSPDGNWVASGSVDSTVKIWDKENGEILLDIKQPQGITYLAFSPDGNYIATASYDAKIRLLKFPEGTMVREFNGHVGTVWSLDFSPDGKTIASCGEDATIRIWNIASGQIEKTLQGHTRNVWDIKFSPDGTKLVSGSFDKTIKVWNFSDGKLLGSLTGHSEAIVAISFSSDGQKLVSTSDDKTIKLWNTNNWSIIYSLEVPEHTQAAEFSPDNKLLVTGGRDKPAIGEFLQNIFGNSELNKGISMRLWEVQTGKLLQTFLKHSNDVNDVSFSPDGKWIASGSSDNTVELWRISNQ